MRKVQWTCRASILPAIFLLLSSSSLFQDVFLDEARENAVQPFVASTPPALAELDPPADGNLNATGLVFEEYNCIGGDKYFDNGIWAFIALPRGNVYRHPLEIWDRSSSPREVVPYDYTAYSYSSDCIHPALPVPVPAEGQYIAGLNVIHKVYGLSSWPQVLVVNSDGYLRLAAEPPRTFGTSFRLGTHNVGGTSPPEEFPVLLKTATEALDDDTAELNFVLDGEAYTGAIQASFVPGVESVLNIQAVYVMRRDLLYAVEPNTGFAGMSSMFWKGEDDTPENDHDEAHDADILKIKYSNGSTTEYPLTSHFSGDPIIVRFPPPPGSRIVSFALEQRDSNADHYTDYASALYETRVSLAVEDINSTVPLQLTLNIFPTTSEYQDNIVAHLTVYENLHKGQEINISYALKAY